MKATQLTPTNAIAPAVDLEGRMMAIIEGMDVADATRRKYSKRVPHLASAISRYVAAGIQPADWMATYRRELEAAHGSASTAAAYYAAATAIMKRLHALGALPADITAGVRGVQTNRGHKRAGVSQTEAARIKEALAGADARTRAIFALLLLQGMRQIEVARLDVEDFDEAGGRLLVQGKGRTDKEVVLLNPAATAALAAHLAASGISEGAMFRSIDRANAGSRLTTRSIARIVKATFAVADVDRTPHGLRHLFVTSLLEALNGDVLRVQRWSRHRSTAMLEVYNDERCTSKTAPAVFAAMGAF